MFHIFIFYLPQFENEIKEIHSLSGDLRKEKKIDVRIVHLEKRVIRVIHI